MNTSFICKYEICFPRFLGNKKYYSLQSPVNVGIFHVMMIFRIFCPSMCKVFTCTCLPFLRNHTFLVHEGLFYMVLKQCIRTILQSLFICLLFTFCLKEYLAHTCMELSPLREKGLQNVGKCSVLTVFEFGGILWCEMDSVFAVSCENSLNFGCLSRQESGTKDLFFIDL